MNTMKQLNEAMKYIEEHLLEEINFEHVSRIACCSEYHFRRIFSYLAGMSLSEYIRKRKLSIAASLLLSSKEKVIDIAFRLGYETPDAFSKAFQVMHGVTPSHLRKDTVMLKTFPPMTFQLTLRGGTEMDYRIVDKGSFYLMGVRGKIPLIYNGPNPHTADVWRKLKQRDLLILMEYTKIEPRGMLTAYGNFDDRSVEGTQLDLFVGVAMDEEMPDRFKERYDVWLIEACTWAVFATIETRTQETWGRISSEWIHTSGYEMTNAPEILWYDTYDDTNPDRKSEIWIPVKKVQGASK